LLGEFTCTEQGCNKAFTKAVLLKKHRREHNGSFICPALDCPQIFPSVFRLSRHRKMHEKGGGDIVVYRLAKIALQEWENSLPRNNLFLGPDVLQLIVEYYW
jgi:hypothetical protein